MSAVSEKNKELVVELSYPGDDFHPAIGCENAGLPDEVVVENFGARIILDIVEKHGGEKIDSADPLVFPAFVGEGFRFGEGGNEAKIWQIDIELYTGRNPYVFLSVSDGDCTLAGEVDLDELRTMTGSGQ